MKTRDATREYRIAQWAQIFQERKIAGMKVKEFCQSRGIGKDMYYYWLRKVREATCEQLVVRDSDSIEHRVTGFAKVEVTTRPALSGTINDNPIHVKYGDVRVSIGDTYPPDKLAVFIRELARL